MKKKIIVFLFLIIVFFATEKKEIIVTSEKNYSIKALNKDVVIDLDLEEYVVGVVACEMPALFDEEALKAMSVAARTYAVYKINNSNKDYDVTLTKNDQCYNTIEEMKAKWDDDYQKYYNKIVTQVESTKNQIMTYNHEAILALYFSISNGYTENVENVFSEKKDYLVSVDSKVDEEYLYKEDTKEYKVQDFLQILSIKNDKIKNIDIQRNSTNRIQEINVNGTKMSGTEFRKKLDLNSTDFSIEEKDDLLIITTRGKGHGVGMSQYGTNVMAKKGYSYDEILSHYYKNIEITNNY